MASQAANSNKVAHLSNARQGLSSVRRIKQTTITVDVLSALKLLNRMQERYYEYRQHVMRYDEEGFAEVSTEADAPPQYCYRYSEPLHAFIRECARRGERTAVFLSEEELEDSKMGERLFILTTAKHPGCSFKVPRSCFMASEVQALIVSRS